MAFFTGYLAQGVGSGIGFVENNASGYARQPVTLQPLYLGSTSLVAGALFSGAATSLMVTQRALFDAPTGGNLIQWWALTHPVSVAAGATDTVSAGSLAHRYPELLYGDPTTANKVWPAGAAVGLTDTGKPIYSGVMTLYSTGRLKANTSYGSVVQPVGHKVGLTGEGLNGAASAFLAAGYTTTLNRYQHTMGPQGASDLQLQYGNFSGAAIPEATPNAVTISAEIEYGNSCYAVSWSGYTAGANLGSVVIPPGAIVTSDPVAIVIPAGAVYYTRTLVSVAAGGLIPACRASNPTLNECVSYSTGTAAQTALGADLVTSAATAAGSNVLTFASTSLAAFGGAVLAVGALVRGAGMVPATAVASFTSTTLTLNVAVSAAIASGTTIHIYGNRAYNQVTGFYPINILGRVRNRSSSVLIIGDSIAAGRFVTGTLQTTAAASVGTNVLTFASSALSGAIMFSGIEVPFWNNYGVVPNGTVVSSFTPTTVTLSNNLIGNVTSGQTITFGQQGDSIGNFGYIERGLVTGFGTGSVAPAVPWCNMSVTGEFLSNLMRNQNAICRFKMLSQGFTHVVDELGINDFSGGTYPNLSAFQAAKEALWTLYTAYGLKVIACTITAETNSTDGWNTPGNQTATVANFAAGGLCQQYNDWIRTLPFPLVGVIDAADAQMGTRDAMTWTTVAVGGTPYPMTVDGIHPVGPGQLVMPGPVVNAVAAGLFT